MTLPEQTQPQLQEVEAAGAPQALTRAEIEGILIGPASEEAGSDPSISRLYRAIFCLKQAVSVEDGIALLTQTLQRKDSAGKPRFASVLFRHECCYLLGQLGADCQAESAREQAYQTLLQVLQDESEDEVTRHEAAEGIAAVYSSGALSEGGSVAAAGRLEASDMFKLLESFALDAESADGLAGEGGGEGGEGGEGPQVGSGSGRRRGSRKQGPLAETCYLAVEGMRRRGATKVCACQFTSHDPALGDPTAEEKDIPKYQAILEDPDADLFERYVAMFTLRNLGDAQVLADVLDRDDSSCVLRHELAFVMGQLEKEAGLSALIKNLGKENEHAMVRHESAIALGSIGGEAAKEALRTFAADPEPMVAESCQVALDTAAYWEAWEALEARLGGGSGGRDE